MFSSRHVSSRVECLYPYANQPRNQLTCRVWGAWKFGRDDTKTGKASKRQRGAGELGVHTASTMGFTGARWGVGICGVRFWER